MSDHLRGTSHGVNSASEGDGLASQGQPGQERADGPSSLVASGTACPAEHQGLTLAAGAQQVHIVRSEPLREDADAWARTISPIEVLQQIGSPFADADLTHDRLLSHAA